MPRSCRLYLRLLSVWLGLALCSAPVLRAAANDDDSDKKPKKTTKASDKSDDDDAPKKKRRNSSDPDKDSEKTTGKSEKSKPAAEKSDDDTPKKKRSRKDPDPDKETAKTSKDSSKAFDKSEDEAPKKRRHKDSDSDKETAKNDKDSGKKAEKSDEDTPKKKKRKGADSDSEKETAKAGKDSEKSADKKSDKTTENSDKDKDKEKDSDKPVKKSSGKKGDKSSLTIPVSKKGDSSSSKDAKDVTDQKADPTREIKSTHEAADGEFENAPKLKEELARAKVDDSFANRREPGRAPSSSSSGTTSSRDMQGWEVVHYQDRDYVTSNSIFRFYRFADHRVEGNAVWFTSSVLIMKAVIGSQELLINNIKFILSHPVEDVNGKILFSRLDLCKLIDPVLRPSYIAGHGTVFDTVIVDAGHGGYDSGARGLYGYEKNFALQLAGLLKADLESRGLKVLLTRSDDTFISLGGRVEFANKVPNSIFVSLHFNSGQSAATGIETYALSPQGTSSDYGARSVDVMAFNGNQRDSENIALATAIHANVVHHFKLVDRGVKRARWYVLTGLERPGVLFEGGFVTNSGDGQLIAAENFRRELAHTIGDAIANYRRALGR